MTGQPLPMGIWADAGLPGAVSVNAVTVQPIADKSMSSARQTSSIGFFGKGTPQAVARDIGVSKATAVI